MANSVSISIGIIGDPHVVIKGEQLADGAYRTQHSFFEVDDETGRITNAVENQHPWLDLLTLTRNSSGSGASQVPVDALLCVGDLGFRGSVGAIQAAWKLLHDAGIAMDASVVAAATGNHDVHSRSQAPAVGKDPIRLIPTIKGPFETLKLLDPPYPLITIDDVTLVPDARDRRAKYFGEGASLYEFEKFRLLLLNSCADHGHDAIEFERGGISSSTLKAIKTDLQAFTELPDKINLALVHHPPHPDSSHGSGTLDHIHEGDQLLKLLQETGQQWFLIHGHKHNGTISYSTGGSGVTVFSAASLGIRLEQQVRGLRNQFYVVNLEIDSETPNLRGTVDCWDWFENFGWKHSLPNDGGICHGCGFGNRQTVSQLANVIAQIAQSSALPLSWTDLLSANPDLRFVMPDEMQQVKVRLEGKHNLTIERDGLGHWEMVAKKS